MLGVRHEPRLQFTHSRPDGTRGDCRSWSGPGYYCALFEEPQAVVAAPSAIEWEWALLAVDRPNPVAF